jgi:hypothetical protein
LIISTDAQKAFDKTQHPFMTKALMKLGMEGMCLNIIKAIFNKHITNIILNGETLKPFHRKSRTIQRCLLFPLLFNIVLEFLPSAIRQEEEINGIQIDQEDVKLSLFTEHMILHLKHLNNSTKKLLDTINSFSKVAGYKINL